MRRPVLAVTAGMLVLLMGGSGRPDPDPDPVSTVVHPATGCHR